MSLLNRERRKNAGKRMAVLGKKLEEEDDAFWSHETWADEEDSGNESFHESDEDSALQKDVFDSDFNDSESDNEDDEVAAGEAEERELRKNERIERKQKSSAYKNADVDFPTLTGQKRRRGTSGVNKRAIGEGFNAGIVLKLPPDIVDSLSYSASIAAKRKDLQHLIQTQQPVAAAANGMNLTAISSSSDLIESPILPSIPVSSTTAASRTVRKTKTPLTSVRKLTRSSRVSLRERRSTHGAGKLQENGRNISRPVALTTMYATNGSTRKLSRGKSSDIHSRVSAAAKKKYFAQEELLLEAVHETEPENKRWLHGRKRVQDQYNREKDSSVSGLRDRYRGSKIVEKFHSRRGCLITLTFPEMDSVPEILTRRSKQQHQLISGEQQESCQSSQSALSFSKELSQQQQQLKHCVITGKIGKYKDPLTNYPYHNLAAFRELRRRHNCGVAIVNKHVYKTYKKFNGGDSSNIKKEPSISSENDPCGKKDLTKGEKCKRSRSTVDSIDVNKKKIARNQEGFEKLLLSAIDDHHKSPFQSPKSAQRLIDDGGKSLPKTIRGSKPHPSNGESSGTNQQKLIPAESLFFSSGRKSNSSTTDIEITFTQSSNSSKSPTSPSGRRLSPRKWKPSEKILETIITLPGNSDGGKSAVPRGFGIKPLLTSSSSRQYFDHLKNRSTTGNNPVIGSLLASTNPEVTLVANPLPREESHISSMGGNNQTNQNVTKECSGKGQEQKM